mgnify:CR=1 FL=1
MENIKLTQPDNNPLKALDTLSPVMDGFGLDKHFESENPTRLASQNPQNNHCYENIDDNELQELIYRIMKQEQSAVAALFKAMAARVNSLALRITGCVQLAEEVTEDTFFQVWRQAPRFDPSRGTAKAWILTIARSRALDARRRIPPFDDLTDDVVNSNWEHQSHDDLPDLLSAIEQNQLLYSALEALEPVPRQLIALSFFRGLSHEEIASHAELPLGTVKSHIRRAVIHLREALASTNLTSVINQ